MTDNNSSKDIGGIESYLPAVETDHVMDAKMEMFSIMENENGILLPIFLKKLLILSGFDNPSAFYDYSDNDIRDLENFATNELFERADGNTIRQIYSEAYIVNFEEKIKQKSFSIAKGHKKTLCHFAKMCVSNCQSITEKFKLFLKRAELKADDQKNLQKNRKRKNSESFKTQPRTQPPIKKRSQDTEKENTLREKEIQNENTRDEPDEIIKIEQHIKQTAINYVKRVTAKIGKGPEKNDILKDVNLDINNINVRNINKDLSKLKCSIDNCKVELNITSIKGSSGVNWITSNFNKHFRNVHLKTVLGKTSSNEEGIEKNSEKDRQKSMLQYVVIKSVPSSEVSSETQTLETPLGSETERLPSATRNSDFSYTNDQSCSSSSESILPIMLLNDLENDSCPVSSFPDTFFAESRGAVEASDSANEIQSPQMKKWKSDLYSRHERNTRKLNCLDTNQKKITDFYKILQELNEQINQPGVKKLIENAGENGKQADDKQTGELGGLLKVLMDTYNKNKLSASPFGNRYSEDLKKISLYIFLIGGRLLYQTLYANLGNSLPSLTSIRNTLDEKPKIREGELRMKELKLFLQKRNLPMKVFVSEDQTAIIKRVHYDPSENRLVGFKTEISKETGLPACNNFYVNFYADIETAFKNHTICSNAFTIVAQPLADKAPSFVLSVFGSDNKFSFQDVLNRWSYIEEQAKIMGIEVEGFATDGDTRALKAMRVKSKLPSLETNIYSPYYCMEFDLYKSVCFQDSIHILTKMKTRFTNPKVTLKMGSHEVSTQHIEKILENYSKDQHFLCKSNLNNADKMNFRSIDWLCHERVTNLLESDPDSMATCHYLKMCRMVIKAYLEKLTTPEERIFFAWYLIFFVRIWRYWISETIENTMQKNFLTSNVYTCIEINGHSILRLLEKCREDNCPNVFLPWLYSSQPCEKMFRQTRSMTSTYSTIVNFSLYEMMRRVDRINAINEITSDLCEKINFPRENEGRLGKYDFNNDNVLAEVVKSSLPTTEQVKLILESAKTQAMKDAEMLNIILGKSHLSLEMISLPILTESNEIEEQSHDEGEQSHDEETTNIIEETLEKTNEPSTKLFDELSDDDENEKNTLEKLFSHENLNIKDYSSSVEDQGKSNIYLTLMLNNGKIIKVKKSSLCWMFANSTGRLSSDRLLRVRGMSDDNTKTKKKTTYKKKQKTGRKEKKKKNAQRNAKENESDDSENESDDESIEFCESDDDFQVDGEILSDNDSNEEDNNTFSNLSIEKEYYYAVYYETQWYIGRVIGTNKDENKSTFKFLEQFMNEFRWPKKDDIQEIENRFVFYGPLKLRGTHPFTLSRYDTINIKNKYKDFKSVGN